ncbi:MAG TPA: ComEC/Rec2 family competence protein [Candidatus Saccharimonadales bacterium]|nr:ComEC/Rec2 family competence protein [Candidatus Saccharimonadales bacterium]
MRFRRTTLITALCLGVLLGIGLSRKVSLIPGIYALLLIPVIPALLRKNIFAMLLVLAIGLTLGLWRGSVYMQNVRELQRLAGREVTIDATASTDSFYGKRSQVQFTAGNINLIYPYKTSLAGSFKLSGFGEKMIYRGDRVRITGRLFPSRGGSQATIAYSKMERIKPGSNIIYDTTRNFNAGMQNALPEPQASFGLGLLIGQRNTLPADITVALTAVGLVHIVAVSGYNLTIIIRGVGRLKLGSRYQKLLLSLALIASFVLMTGFSASIVRAAIVSVLSLWAWYYGRRLRPIVLIGVTAALTGLWNPYYVWSDIGWYLSFLAFFGVLVIAPVIAARLFNRPPGLLTMVVIESLSAEIMTLPLILMTFSQLSLIALAANMLIVPLVPLAMLLSAAAAAAGAVIPQFAGWIAFPARILLTYMLDVVHVLAGLPSVFIRRGISLPYMLLLYGFVVVALTAAYRKLSKDKKSRAAGLQITP